MRPRLLLLSFGQLEYKETGEIVLPRPCRLRILGTGYYPSMYINSYLCTFYPRFLLETKGAYHEESNEMYLIFTLIKVFTTLVKDNSGFAELF